LSVVKKAFSYLNLKALIGEVIDLSLMRVIVISVLFNSSISYGLSGDINLNYLNLAETKRNINRSHLELEFNLKYQRKKPVRNRLESYPSSLSNIHPTAYMSVEDNQYFDFVFDFSFYGVTYVDYAFLLPEAYLNYTTGISSFIIGRKIPEVQLFVDTLWQQGIDQAFFRMNPFDAREQGRLAATYVLQSDSVVVEAFFSPFSIPDQGPSFDFKNGQATSDNPWANNPPRQVVLSDTGTFNLSYQVEDDSVPELINNLQYGLAVSIVSDYIKIDGFYYNKSSKQLGLSIDATIDSDTVGEIDVTAKPFFIDEHLFGVQLESKWFDNFKMTNGFYGMAIDTSTLEDGVPYRTEISDYFFISTGMHFDLDWSNLVLAHMYRRERPFEEMNTVYFNNRRFLHGNAVKVLLSDLNYRRLSFNSEVLFGIEEKGLFIETGVSYRYSPSLRFNAQLNLIEDFSDELSQSALSESIFSQFSELDNIRLGVQYVF